MNSNKIEFNQLSPDLQNKYNDAFDNHVKILQYKAKIGKLEEKQEELFEQFKIYMKANLITLITSDFGNMSMIQRTKKQTLDVNTISDVIHENLNTRDLANIQNVEENILNDLKDVKNTIVESSEDVKVSFPKKQGKFKKAKSASISTKKFTVQF